MTKSKVISLALAAVFTSSIAVSTASAIMTENSEYNKKRCVQGYKWDEKLKKCVEDQNSY